MVFACDSATYRLRDIHAALEPSPLCGSHFLPPSPRTRRPSSPVHREDIVDSVLTSLIHHPFWYWCTLCHSSLYVYRIHKLERKSVCAVNPGFTCGHQLSVGTGYGVCALFQAKPCTHVGLHRCERCYIVFNVKLLRFHHVGFISFSPLG